MVRIRLKRLGRRHRPFYRINAIEKRNQRDGVVLENLGWYDPMARDTDKQLSLKVERIKHWLSQGAQPSDTMNDILAQEGIINADAWQAKRTRRVEKKIKKIAEKRTADAAAAASSSDDA